MSKTVLVVEDNEMNMKLFCDILEMCGYRTVRAYSGMAARQALEACNPDLIVMDIQLPDTSGIDLIREIRSHRLLSTIPILAVTAFTMKGFPERIVTSGGDRFMKKPIAVAEFIATVDEMVNEFPTEHSRRDLRAGNTDSNDHF